MAQSFISSPLELVKLRLQLQGQGVRHSFRQMAFYYDNDLYYKGPVDCLKKVYVKEGFNGVMRGTVLTIIRDVPGFGLYFASYEYFVRMVATEAPAHYSVVQHLFAGGKFLVATKLLYWNGPNMRSSIFKTLPLHSTIVSLPPYCNKFSDVQVLLECCLGQCTRLMS